MNSKILYAITQLEVSFCFCFCVHINKKKWNEFWKDEKQMTFFFFAKHEKYDKHERCNRQKNCPHLFWKVNDSNTHVNHNHICFGNLDLIIAFRHCSCEEQYNLIVRNVKFTWNEIPFPKKSKLWKIKWVFEWYDPLIR